MLKISKFASQNYNISNFCINKLSFNNEENFS